jgi:hypothetical protein
MKEDECEFQNVFSEAEVEYLSAVPTTLLIHLIVLKHIAGIIFPCTFPLPACSCEYII